MFRRPKLLIAALLFASSATLFASPLWWMAASGNAVNQAAQPNFSPTGFTSVCHPQQTITISTTTTGAQIRYNKGVAGTVTDPDCSTGTLINASSGTAIITAHQDTEIRAVAFTTCGGSPDTSTVAETEYDFSC